MKVRFNNLNVPQASVEKIVAEGRRLAGDKAIVGRL
jgi:hypothetical protein